MDMETLTPEQLCNIVEQDPTGEDAKLAFAELSTRLDSILNWHESANYAMWKAGASDMPKKDFGKRAAIQSQSQTLLGVPYKVTDDKIADMPDDAYITFEYPRSSGTK